MLILFLDVQPGLFLESIFRLMLVSIYSIRNASIFRRSESIFSPILAIFSPIFRCMCAFIFRCWLLLGAISGFRFGFLAIERKHYPELLGKIGWILRYLFI